MLPIESLDGITYTGLSSGLRQCELITLSWADFHVRYRYILKGQRLLTLNAKAERLLKQLPETDSPYVFLNPKTGAEYKLGQNHTLPLDTSEGLLKDAMMIK